VRASSSTALPPARLPWATGRVRDSPRASGVDPAAACPKWRNTPYAAIRVRAGRAMYKYNARRAVSTARSARLRPEPLVLSTAADASGGAVCRALRARADRGLDATSRCGG
jgi:hypothetical protein